MNTKNNKLTFGNKCGYSFAAVGDAVAYTFINTFILFFLTTVAGLQPAVAGTIAAIGSIWDAAINPVIGYLSDHSVSSFGRRRKYMLGFCFPLFASMVLLYTAVDFTYSVKVLYYGFMVIAYWTSFTGFFVPFYALGAEYTQDYGERTSLRSFASFFNTIGTWFSMAMPTFIVEFLENCGFRTSSAWSVTAAALGVFTVVSIILTVSFAAPFDSRGERLNHHREPLSLMKLFREYSGLLRLKPMRMLLMTSLFFLIAYAMFIGDFMYFVTYNLGFAGGEVSGIMALRCFACMIIIPPTAYLCKKTDKRTALMIILAGSGMGCALMRFITMDSMFIICVYILIMSIATSTYWQIVPAMFYDVCEYDEYATGQRREGTIVSVQGLVEAAATGIGAQILGIILQFAGFNGEADIQTEAALDWIYNCTTWVPVIFIVIAIVTLYRFPITKEYFNEIMQKLEERKEKQK